MTWREFLLKKQGWEREQLRKWERAREIAYWSGRGTAFDGKVSIQKFMPLGNERPKSAVSDAGRRAFELEMENYNKQIQNGK